MGGTEKKYIDEAFASNYIAPVGPMLERFECAVAAYTGNGAFSACALSSATAGLDLLFDYYGVEAGDAVICSDLTFIASIAPAVRRGAVPYFVDCEPESWTISCDGLREAFKRAIQDGRRIAAVVAVDLYGICCDYRSIEALCAEYGVPLIEDAAEALGSSFIGEDGLPHLAGTAGDAAVFSFNGNKIITSSGGGMVLSDDAEMISRLRFLSTQAKKPGALSYEHERLGYNYRMSNIAAAIGLGQLDILDEKLARRRRIFERYCELLPDFIPICCPSGYVSNNWLTAMLLPSGTTAAPIDIVNKLNDFNIEARPVWKPMHMQVVFKDAYCTGGGSVAESIYSRGICLPSGDALTDEDLQRITAIIKECV